MAPPSGERTAGIWDGLDHPAAAALHAESSGPGRVHHQGRCHQLGFRRGKIPYIDYRDMAAVAFVTLTQPAHLGKKYVLTGSEAMFYRQAAEIIGAAIGKPVRFVDESPDEARARRVRERYGLLSSRALSRSPRISVPAGKP